MHDIKKIVDNPDVFKKAKEVKGDKNGNVDLIVELYSKRRALQAQVDTVKAQINKISGEVAQLKREKKDAVAKIEESKKLGEHVKVIETDMTKLDAEVQKEAQWLPNIPAENVPVGGGYADNKQVKEWGKTPDFPFLAKTHLDLVESLDIADMKRAGRMTGSHFVLYKREGALLERALINFFLDTHTTKHGYTEISPPFIVNRETLFGTGQLPKLEDDMYYLGRDDFFLIPTAEVPITNIHRDEILNWTDLPVKYCSYSACFRREAGAYGADTRGMKRIHQFDKVEMVKLAHPDKSFQELEALLNDAEELLQALGLQHRVILLCTGETSFASAKTYDIETFAPASKEWLEVSSCSNFTEFQARRIGIRFRDQDKKVKFVHTLNGSGLALPRVFISILETYQQADGSVLIPEVLHKYTNGVKLIKPKGK